MLSKDVHHQSGAQQANVQLELTPKCKGCPMGFRSALVPMSTVGLFTLGFLASWGATRAVADPSGDRLGCGSYCQSAGGYGAVGHAPEKQAVTIVSTGTVTADADGYVPVTLTCDLSVQCTGALLVSLNSPAAQAALGYEMTNRYGRSDLLVNAGATRTIAVPLPAPALAWLRSNSPTSLGVTADSQQGSVSGSGIERLAVAKLTVVAPG
jgi:hypothetical protein